MAYYLPDQDEQMMLAPMAASYSGGAPDLSGAQDSYIPQAPSAPAALGAPAAAPPTAPMGVPSTLTPSPAPAPLAAPQPGMGLFATQVASAESGNDPNAKNPQSSASGRFQITDGTLYNTLKNHPDLAAALQGKSDLDKKNDPRVQAATTEDNKAFLTKALGRDPNPTDLMAAWFLGPAGATQFLQAYAKNPATPVDQVVSIDALQKNHSSFYHADGTTKTVGEVYQATQAKVSTAMQGGSSGGGGSAAPASTPGAANPYAQQQSDLQAYIKGQPAMWAKLDQMQKDYLAASKPTFGEENANFLNQMSQQQAANNALMHSNQGGILLHADPDNSAYIKTLQNSHDIDAAQQAQRLGTARTAYEVGAGTLAAQNAQLGKNLELGSGLAKDTLQDQNTKTGLGIQQQQANTEQIKAAAETALAAQQAGVTQQKAFSDFMEHAVPNPDTRAAILTELGNTTGGSLNDNIKAATVLIGKHQANNEPIAVRQPAIMIEAVVPDEHGQPVRSFINIATPEGLQQLQQLPKNAVTRNLTSPGNNVTQTNSAAGGGEGGGGSSATNPADDHMRAILTKQAAQAALELLPYISAHGGTGVLTDDPNSDSSKFLNKLKQVTGIDYTGQDVRQVYDKLMQQVQLGLTLPQMKQMGARPAAAEFAQLMAGQLGATATTTAAQAFLTHVSKTMDFTRRQIEELNQQAQQAKQNNNVYFDPVNARIQWQSKPGNQPPVWDSHSLLESVTPQPGARPPPNGPSDNQAPLPTPAAPAKGATGTSSSGRPIIYDGTSWKYQ